MNKKVYINNGDHCTFGTLSQIWDNGYVKIAYIKFPFKWKATLGMGAECGVTEIDFICCLEEDLNFI